MTELRLRDVQLSVSVWMNVVENPSKLKNKVNIQTDTVKSEARDDISASAVLILSPTVINPATT